VRASGQTGMSGAVVFDDHKPVRGAVVFEEHLHIYGYEYEGWPMEPAIEAFEVLARERVVLGDRHSASFQGLVHPVHKQGQVVAWELLSKL